MKITARLENWYFSKLHNQVVGEIYNDARGIFPDGSTVTTSTLLEMSKQESTPKEGAIIKTRNSAYLLGKEQTLS